MIKIILSILTFLIVWPTGAQAIVFDRNFQLGETDLRIKILQILLNLEPGITVSSLGPGSSGQETDYFGEKTKNALIRFQVKYNLHREKGYLGASTRSLLDFKLEQWLKPSSPILTVPAALPAPQKPISVSVTKKVPRLITLSPSGGGNRASITIKGENFLSNGNRLRSNFAEDVLNLSSNDGQTLTFLLVVPDYFLVDEEDSQVRPSLNLPINLWVENVNGRSNYLRYDFRQ